MDTSEFLVHCKVLLEKKQVADLLIFLLDEKNKALVRFCGWELVGVLCRHLEDDEIAESSNKCLEALLQTCSSKEVILGLSEQLINKCSLNTFATIMVLCTKAIITLQRRQSKYFSTVCDQVIFQMKCIVKSSEEATANDIIAEGKPSEADAEQLFTCIYQFVNCLVEKIGRQKHLDLEHFLCETMYSDAGWEEYEIIACRKILLNFIFIFLEHLLEIGFLNLSSIDSAKEYLSKLVACVFKLTTVSEMLECNQYEVQNLDGGSVGFSILLYLIFVQQIALQHMPCVYRSGFVFALAAKHIGQALERSHKQAVETSLELLSELLSILPAAIFKKTCVVTSHTQIAMGLTNVMIWSQEEILREKSRNLFVLYLEKYELLARYLMIRFVYDESKHPGLLGYLINLTNKVIQEIFQDEEETDSKLEIRELCLTFTHFTPGEHHVLQESDRLIEGLNFVRFWLLKDSCPEKKTGIWNSVTQLENNLSTILTCIDIAKANFGTSLNELSKVKNTTDDVLVHLMIPGDDMLQQLPNDEKTKAIHMAMLTLDMMASVATRINEIIKGTPLKSSKN